MICPTRRRAVWPGSCASALTMRSSRPRPATGPDSLALAEYCGAALLTVEISSTKRQDVEDSFRRLTRLGAPVARPGRCAPAAPARRPSQDAGQFVPGPVCASARLR